MNTGMETRCHGIPRRSLFGAMLPVLKEMHDDDAC